MQRKVCWSLGLVMVLILGYILRGQVQASTLPKRLDVTAVSVNEYFPNNEGTFILRDLENGKTFIYNQKLANEGKAPQSTFKIPNALIGLQVKAVRDEYEVKRWDGVKRSIDVWNQDHTLASAMRYSTVWYYQDLARTIGEASMQEWLEKCSYGNQDISGGIDHFWLSSSLKISPFQQADFLGKLYTETLPFDKSVMKTVKRMMIQEEGDHYILYGKTGTGAESTMGWFVGYITVNQHPYLFVTYIEGEDCTGLKAKRITLEILKKYKLLTNE
jgi:beta-lactamase class D